jgi:Tol biopolymer transport system component
MRPVEGGDELQLTNTDEQHEIAAAFSPRGDQLAFVRVTLPDEGPPPPCEIIVQPFPQGMGRRVGGCETATDTFRLSWSADGTSILFSEPVEGSMFGTGRVRRLDIATGRTSDFIPPPSSGPGDFNAVYSPSGRRVAFVRYTDTGVAELRLFDTRTRRESTLMDGLAWAHLDWIDDDRLIAATRVSNTQRSVDLWTLNRDGAAPQHLLPSLTELARVDHANGVLAFQVSSSVENLRQFAAGRQTNLTSANVQDHDADFSRDGALAYISVGAREWIYLQQPGEPPRRFIETAGHSAYGLRWSNDGRRLVYSGVSDGRRRLFVTDVGSGVTQVVATPESEEATNPAWGLNDRSLIYAGLTDRGARLMRVAFDSTQPAQPISGYGWVEAVETADGVLARQVDTEGVWLLRENAEPRLLCRELQRVGLTRFSARDWQVGGDRIYVLETSDTGSRVSYCPIAGGPAQLVFELEGTISGSLAVHPTTGAIVFAELVEQQADVAIAQLVRVGMLGGGRQ